MKTLALVCILLWPLVAHATKPCPASPCFNSSGEFIEKQCFEAAEWVAVGNVGNVVQRQEGKPLNKNFANFSLEVERWEKGNLSTKVLQLNIGWCDPDFPKGENSRFRIYGSGGNNQQKILAMEELN